MADTWSIFDIIGPVMIGPSSSHTAGACFIGLIARHIFNAQPKKIHIKLHGSFGQVYKGHGTDKALIAGLLKMSPYDVNLANSFDIAHEKGIDFSFESCDLGADVHPNTAFIEIENDEKKITVQGESIGGGKCRITEVDKIPIIFGPERSCLIVKYKSENQLLPRILEIVQKKKYNIIAVESPSYKDRNLAVIEIRENYDEKIVEEMEEIEGVIWASYINHFSHYNQQY